MNKEFQAHIFRIKLKFVKFTSQGKNTKLPFTFPGTIGDLSDGESLSGHDTEGLLDAKKAHKRALRKTARARTVLSEKQLNILKTCYSANPRPDALMKEQLVEMTGLSPRVIRVWFQNKRCKVILSITPYHLDLLHQI